MAAMDYTETMSQTVWWQLIVQLQKKYNDQGTVRIIDFTQENHFRI
jgi:hypothetical protein